MAVKDVALAGWLWAGLALGNGCSHAAPTPTPPCTAPEPLRISVAASPRLNPGEKGEALATVVRVYQLKTTGKLTGASFDDLLDRDRDALGEDFLSVQELTINPGDKMGPPVARNADAGYVAAVALFRQPSGSTWRAVRKLAPADPNYCHAAAKPGKPPIDPVAPVARFFLDENRIELR
ncbi:MAG TPA: type VI secretion system lipoprotein TssJ [Polyangia bacterium]|jgi:type VI secretion system VasD/TssJ family lipoprotein|nr:type VI secretion system lipoprotein TssJ [Polyangia bacterium]